MKRVYAMMKYARALMGAIAIGLMTQSAPAQAAVIAPEADQIVNRLHDSIIAAMKASGNPQDRQKVLDDVVRESFDFPLMTKVVAGPAWGETSAVEKEQLIKAFTDLSVATYAARFKNFKNQRFMTIDQAQGPKGTLWVKTNFMASESKTVKLNYLMRREGDEWKIIDVYLDGSVSEMATRRADYAQVVSQGGVKALTQALQDQTASLLRGTDQ